MARFSYIQEKITSSCATTGRGFTKRQFGDSRCIVIQKSHFVVQQDGVSETI